MAWVIDLDGVVWLVDDAIAGAAEAIARLRAAGERLAFVTNFSFGRRADIDAKLRAHGIDPGDDVVTSAMAAATLVEPEERVLVCGGPGVVEALEGRGCDVVFDGDADAVVVGYHDDFDYRRMTVASTAVLRGARLIGTNGDSTYPTPAGPIPGAGAILASIVTATGATPTIAGKPHRPVADLVRARLGADGVVVGDRVDTDGALAAALGYRFALVLSGVTTGSDLPVDPAPDEVAADLATLVGRHLA